MRSKARLLVVRSTLRRRRPVGSRVLAATLAILAVAGTACGGDGGGEVGLVAGGSFPFGPPAGQPPPLVGGPMAPPTTAFADPPLEAGAPTHTAPPPATTIAPVTTPTTRPPVPLPTDPAAVVLSLRWLSGYPFPGGSLIVQPIELQAEGRLVRPVPAPPSEPPWAYHRLAAFEVPVAEVRALVAAAEDAGATVPPADLGHDPDMADAGALVVQVDRPGLRSELVVRDPVEQSNDARGLTPDQMSRRRAVLDLATRLQEAGRPAGPVRSSVRVVGFLPPKTSGPTATWPVTDQRIWTGPALHMGPLWGCVDVAVDDLDRQVPGWSSATTSTSWRAGSEMLQMAFYDATRPTVGCTAP